MKDKYRLIYGPVLSVYAKAVFKSYPYRFHNATTEKRKTLTKDNQKAVSQLLCDSGGYQIYMIEKRLREKKSKKRWRIEPWADIRNSKKWLIIDPIDVCRRYGQWDIKDGMTLDIPLRENATQLEFEQGVVKSFECADLMFRYRQRFCPQTDLLIPLHYVTKENLYHSYEMMSQLSPDGYAIAVRGTSNRDDFLRVAYSLCFLHHKEVKLLHMFGSSRAEIIVLGAAAVGLRMFNQVSFDSRSWNTSWYCKKWQYPDYLDRKTLQKKPLIEPHKTRLVLPKHIYRKSRSEESGDSFSAAKDLILLNNIMVTHNYAQAMVLRAGNIERLKRFVNKARHLRTQRKRLTLAIKLLNTAKHRGYPFVEQWWDWLWD